MTDIIVDNQLLSDFGDCPHYGYYIHELGYRPKAMSTALAFGDSFHKGLGTYYDSERDPSKATLAFVANFIQFTGLDDKRTPEKGEELILAYDQLYRNEPLEDLGGEIEFVFPLAKLDSNTWIMYSGIIDRPVRYQGHLAPMEWKTSSYPNDFVVAPNNQVTGYALALQEHFGEPVYMAIVTIAGVFKGSENGFMKAKKGFEPRSIYRREFPTFAPWNFAEFTEDVIQRVNDIVNWRSQRNWPKTTTHCSKWGGCPFIPICAIPPDARQFALDQAFVLDKWIPGKRRP